MENVYHADHPQRQGQRTVRQQRRKFSPLGQKARHGRTNRFASQIFHQCLGIFSYTRRHAESSVGLPQLHLLRSGPNPDVEHFGTQGKAHGKIDVALWNLLM